MLGDDQFWPPISLMHVHGSLPGQAQYYTYCTDIDDQAVRLELLATLHRDFVAPDGVEWGTYEPQYEETFWAGPITPENIADINAQLARIVISVGLAHVPSRHQAQFRESVHTAFSAIGPDEPTSPAR